MRYEWLASFEAFARHLNFTRVAEERHLSQPAVYNHVRDLADALEVQLYVRLGRRLELTQAGERTARFALEALRSVRRFEVELREGDPSEAVALVAGHGALAGPLRGPLKDYRVSHADSRLSVMARSARAAMELLLADRADVGMVVAPTAPDALDSVLFGAFPMQVALPVGHALLAHDQLTFSDLGGVAMIAPPVGFPVRSVLQTRFADAGANLAVTVEATGWGLVLQFVSDGYGVSVVNGTCGPTDGVVYRPLEQAPIVRYWLARARHVRDSSAAARLYEWLGRYADSAGAHRQSVGD